MTLDKHKLAQATKINQRVESRQYLIQYPKVTK